MPHTTPSNSSQSDRKSPADTPSYFIAEAAHYLSLPTRTVRDWVLGRKYPTTSGEVYAKPLVRSTDPAQRLLSFTNLVELHVISSIRRAHRVNAKSLRKAIDYLERAFGTKHPLLAREMLTDGTDLFIERYESLVNISADGQLCIKAALDAYLKRIEWDDRHVPRRLFPFSRPSVENAPQLIVIDPRVRSGRPCITGTGVPTSIVVGRHKAGDSVALLANDYGRTPEEIEEALRYESRAAS